MRLKTPVGGVFWEAVLYCIDLLALTDMDADFHSNFPSSAMHSWVYNEPMPIRFSDHIKRLTVLSICLLCAACQRADSLDRIMSEGELRVVTRSSPTTFYLDQGRATGFEYELTDLLAKELGVALKIEPEFSLDGIFYRLRRNDAHIAAAGLTLTGPRMSKFPYSAPYSGLTPLVIYKAGNFRPGNLADLAGRKIAVLAGSSHVEALLALRETGQNQLTWEQIDSADSMELLELVASDEIPLAIIDSNEFRVLQVLYPRIKIAFELGSEQQMGWFLSPDTDNTRLIERINTLFQSLEESGELERLRELHFTLATGISRMSSHAFSRNVAKRLPSYKTLIKEVADDYLMDWELLAAIAYQESHWNPLATSPTGVRGLMMLTLPTAEYVGVKDRLDPAESLRGGALYLRRLKQGLPDDIREPDRTWFGLAAYNIGIAHLEDARVLTERQGGDPHLWDDVRERLPLLQKPEFYANTRYGYARGQEAANYVRNIRHYYSILEWEDFQKNQPRPPVDTDEYLPDILRSSRLSAL